MTDGRKNLRIKNIHNRENIQCNSESELPHQMLAKFRRLFKRNDVLAVTTLSKIHLSNEDLIYRKL